MKKTIWRPLILGIILGLLAGITIAAGLSFLTSSSESSNAIGIYATLFLIAAALGGPLAGAIAPAIMLTMTTFLGPPEMKDILTDPAIFWSNMIALATVLILVSIAYRWIFERYTLPVRLFPWAGIVILYYVLNIPASIILQYVLLQDFELLPAIIFSYQTYIPQAIFDIFITSLVFMALPRSYTRPLWYESKQNQG